MSRKFILNADDFGMSKAYNRAVLEGYNNGFLSSASLCANGKAFNAAVNEILPECPDLGIGVHLNIIEGKALTKVDMLTNKKGKFNKGFLYLLLNSGNEKFLYQVEQEFRAQIEHILQYTQVDHLDSHVHVHSIPNIFKIVCRLAKEYGIPYVRTQHEEFYIIPCLKKHLSLKYPVNILKVILLNYFSAKNKKVIQENNLRTNDYLLGVGYTGMMDSDAIACGLEELEGDCIAEALIHPCNYLRTKSDQHYNEFLITQDKALEDKIKRLEFEITNYKKMF